MPSPSGRDRPHVAVTRVRPRGCSVGCQSLLVRPWAPQIRTPRSLAGLIMSAVGDSIRSHRGNCAELGKRPIG